MDAGARRRTHLRILWVNPSGFDSRRLHPTTWGTGSTGPFFMMSLWNVPSTAPGRDSVQPDLHAHPDTFPLDSGGHVCRIHGKRVRNVQDARPKLAQILAHLPGAGPNAKSYLRSSFWRPSSGEDRTTGANPAEFTIFRISKLTHDFLARRLRVRAASTRIYRQPLRARLRHRRATA
jgi:hypothetical protein